MLKALIKIKSGQALIRNGAGGTQVSFDRAVVIPVLHEYELVDITVQKLTYERVGDWALNFKCGTRAELTADLMLRINMTEEDIKRAVQFLGSERINDAAQLREHFSSMFNDSLEVVAGSMEYKVLVANKDDFREALLKHLGSALNGMVADDVCIHHFRKV